MRVLLANKFYYPRGGDCVAMLNTEQALQHRGHEVAVYAMQHPLNMSSPWSKYWPSEVTFDGPLSNKFKTVHRLLGSNEVAQSFSHLLNDFKPDVVHLHNIHSQLSPVLARLAHKHGCRVVWTMHDYKLVCPAYTCLNSNGERCEHCITGSKWNVVKHRCMKGSLVASVAAWAEAMRWKLSKLMLWTDAVICPSQFMANILIKAGVAPNKIAVIPNFTDSTTNVVSNRDNYYCYVGRLAPEKGIKALLQVASRLPYQLKVAGTGALEQELRMHYCQCKNIEFLGQLNHEQVQTLVSHAQALVTPSQWYENNPISIIEALTAGTPVVGTRMGGIPELINNDNGITVDITTLADGINLTMSRQWDYKKIAEDAREAFSENRHIDVLLNKIYIL